MVTKQKKKEQIEKGKEIFKRSKALIFVDFTGTPTRSLNLLRDEFKEIGSKFQVFKKRIFKIVLKENNIEQPVDKFDGQLGVIFIPDNFEKNAKIVYKFSKNIPNLKIIGGIDLVERRFLDPDYVKMIGSLPSREVLLAQLLMMLTMPIKKLLFVLNEKAKRSEI